MSVEVPNNGFLICPCGRHVQLAEAGESPGADPKPHRPGRTAGMPNLGSRKARKAAWCDAWDRVLTAHAAYLIDHPTEKTEGATT